MERKHDMYGIGNALVDIIIEVDDSFFVQNKIEKGVMTLVDEKTQTQLINSLDMGKSKMMAGGSAANTAISLSQFGGTSYYSFMTARDELGKFFINDIERNGVLTNLQYEHCPKGHSGRCLVMVSPDAERTMHTFLGVSSFFSADQINKNAIKNATYTYLEGYLVTSPKGTQAMIQAKKIAEEHNIRTALTFSDPNVVRFFSQNLEHVIGNGIDLLFCNEQEALMYTETDQLSTAREKLKQVAKCFVITLGANGSLIYDGQNYIEIKPTAVKAVDTNGAGDMFAGAFLYGITHGRSYAESGEIASRASAYIVSQPGPRLEPEQAKKMIVQILR